MTSGTMKGVLPIEVDAFSSLVISMIVGGERARDPEVFGHVHLAFQFDAARAHLAGLQLREQGDIRGHILTGQVE